MEYPLQLNWVDVIVDRPRQSPPGNGRAFSLCVQWNRQRLRRIVWTPTGPLLLLPPSHQAAGHPLNLDGVCTMWRTAESMILYAFNWALIAAMVAGGFYVLF